MSRTQLDSKMGLYGKMPIFGDFVVRNLNAEFINSWDVWLQDGMSNSRLIMGNSWLDKYLAAPIWRFVIGPRILGDNAWIGIVMPSIDRVGRYFPLTLAQAIDPDIDLTSTYLANCDWFRSVEKLGGDALEHDLDFNLFESRMSGIPAPDALVDMNAGDVTIPLLKTAFLSTYFNLPSDIQYDNCISQIRDAISTTHQPVSLWGTESINSHEHFVLASEALPNQDKFCALWDMNFEAHGWVDASKRCIHDTSLAFK